MANLSKYIDLQPAAPDGLEVIAPRPSDTRRNLPSGDHTIGFACVKTLLRVAADRGEGAHDLGCAAKNDHIRSVAGTLLPLNGWPGHMCRPPWIA